MVLLSVSIVLSIRTGALKMRLDEYSVSLIDTTNRKWGFGEPLLPGGFDGSAANTVATHTLQAESLPVFNGNGVEGNPRFPASIDVVDDRRPHDVIVRDKNVVITPHVSLRIQSVSLLAEHLHIRSLPSFNTKHTPPIARRLPDLGVCFVAIFLPWMSFNKPIRVAQ
jgi:hypothetical protein